MPQRSRYTGQSRSPSPTSNRPSPHSSHPQSSQTRPHSTSARPATPHAHQQQYRPPGIMSSILAGATGAFIGSALARMLFGNNYGGYGAQGNCFAQSAGSAVSGGLLGAAGGGIYAAVKKVPFKSPVLKAGGVVAAVMALTTFFSCQSAMAYANQQQPYYQERDDERI